MSRPRTPVIILVHAEPLISEDEILLDKYREQTDGSGQNVTTESSKALLKSTSQDSAHQQQQHQIVDDVVDSLAESPPDVKQVLADIGIFEPSLSNLLASPRLTPVYARRWRDWFVAQSDYGTGWVIRQMESGLLPPEQPPIMPLPEYKTPELSPLEQQWAQVADFIRGTMTADMHHNIIARAHVVSLTDPPPDEEAKRYHSGSPG